MTLRDYQQAVHDKTVTYPGGKTRIMLDLSPQRIAQQAAKFHFKPWQLRTPLTKNRLAGLPYGLDNGCFGGFLPAPWFRLLQEAKQHTRTTRRTDAAIQQTTIGSN